jgi:anti-sigma B factor antagonist
VAAALNRIEIERSDDSRAVVRLEGEQDLTSEPELKQRLRELIGESRSIVVDLGGATFLDSSILAAVLEAREESRAAGVELSLSMPSVTAPAVRRVVEITGLAAAVPTEGGEPPPEGSP